MRPADDKDQRENIIDTTIIAGLSGAQAEVVQRYGSAIKEHFVAYSGTDNEVGQQLAKGLKDISQSKINPAFQGANVKQQAGFSAEVKTVARENAERIISADKPAKTTRTDDIARQSDGRGHMVGGKNEQLYDIAEIDSNGIYLEGSGRQLKYVGGTPKECKQKLLGKKFDQYRDADVPIEIPADFYEDVSQELAQESKKLQAEIAKAKKAGNTDLAAQKHEKLKRVEKTKANLRKGKLSNEEAIEARLHPKLSTAKDIAKISHHAGIEGAKIGAMIGGGISVIRNTVAVIKGDISAQEAAVGVVEDTAKSTAISYATNFIGSAVKGAMQNGSNAYVQALSKSNLPAALVTSALDVGKTLSRFGKGEIDGTECLTELGEKGTGMLAASAGSTVGAALFVPCPILGGLIGGMVGYALSSAYYNNLVNVLKEAKLAHEERLRIEAECQEAIATLKEYRLQVELAVTNYLREHIAVFSSALSNMEYGLETADVDLFIEGSNQITRQVGGTPLFETKEQCDALMDNPQIIIL